MADNILPEQKQQKKVNFSEPGKQPFAGNRYKAGSNNRGGQSENSFHRSSQLEGGAYNRGPPLESPFPGQTSREHQYHKSRGPYNKSTNETGGPYTNRNKGPFQDTQNHSDFSTRNRGHSELESKSKVCPDHERPFHNRKDDNRSYFRQNFNQTKDYESIHRNRGNHNGAKLQRSRSFGQSGVGKAMENFGVKDLREILDRKHQNRDDKVNDFDTEPKKKVPPKNPDYNILKDPLRENPIQVDESGSNNHENQNDREPRNKHRPNQGIYQPNRNKNLENLPKIIVKNHPQNKQDNLLTRLENQTKNKPKHNPITSETIKDLPNIKIQLTVDSNSRTAELDHSVKIPELKHFPDKVGKGGNFRGRGRGRGRSRGGFRGQGRGARNFKEQNQEDSNIENEVSSEQAFESEYTEVSQHEATEEMTQDTEESTNENDSIDAAKTQVGNPGPTSNTDVVAETTSKLEQLDIDNNKV